MTTLARHGGSYGPQLVAALADLKTGYQGSPASLPGHDVVWFCNALNFSAQYAGFDDSYYRDDLFEPVFEKLKADLPGVIKTSQVLALFARASDQDPGRGVLGPELLLRQEHPSGGMADPPAAAAGNDGHGAEEFPPHDALAQGPGRYRDHDLSRADGHLLAARRNR